MGILDQYSIEDIQKMSSAELRELLRRLDLDRVEDRILARGIRQELKLRGEVDIDDNPA